eukprot:11163877-Lingulodinium_polyedra.AAC.1
MQMSSKGMSSFRRPKSSSASRGKGGDTSLSLAYSCGGKTRVAAKHGNEHARHRTLCEKPARKIGISV